MKSEFKDIMDLVSKDGVGGIIAFIVSAILLALKNEIKKKGIKVVSEFVFSMLRVLRGHNKRDLTTHPFMDDLKLEIGKIKINENSKNDSEFKENLSKAINYAVYRILHKTLLNTLKDIKGMGKADASITVVEAMDRSCAKSIVALKRIFNDEIASIYEAVLHDRFELIKTMLGDIIMREDSDLKENIWDGLDFLRIYHRNNQSNIIKRLKQANGRVAVYKGSFPHIDKIYMKTRLDEIIGE